MLVPKTNVDLRLKKNCIYQLDTEFWNLSCLVKKEKKDLTMDQLPQPNYVPLQAFASEVRPFKSVSEERDSEGVHITLWNSQVQEYLKRSICVHITRIRNGHIRNCRR